MEKKDELLGLLRAEHKFPGPYTFKFIGLEKDDFVKRLVTTIKDALGDLDEPTYEIQPSKNQNYVAVTLHTIVFSAEQVLEVYEKAQQVIGLKASL